MAPDSGFEALLDDAPAGEPIPVARDARPVQAPSTREDEPIADAASKDEAPPPTAPPTTAASDPGAIGSSLAAAFVPAPIELPPDTATSNGPAPAPGNAASPTSVAATSMHPTVPPAASVTQSQTPLSTPTPSAEPSQDPQQPPAVAVVAPETVPSPSASPNPVAAAQQPPPGKDQTNEPRRTPFQARRGEKGAALLAEIGDGRDSPRVKSDDATAPSAKAPAQSDAASTSPTSQSGDAPLSAGTAPGEAPAASRTQPADLAPASRLGGADGKPVPAGGPDAAPASSSAANAVDTSGTSATTGSPAPTPAANGVHAAARPHADPASHQDAPARLERMLDALSGELKTGRNEFRLRLDPAELGRLDVRIVAHGNGVVMHVVTERKDVAEWLRSDLPILHKTAERDGLNVLGVEVRSSVDLEQRGGGAHTAAYDDGRDVGAALSARPRVTRAAPAKPQSTLSRPHGVDLLV